MTDKKDESEPQERNEELRLEPETIRDLDVPESDDANVKGGVPENRCSAKESGCN